MIRFYSDLGSLNCAPAELFVQQARQATVKVYAALTDIVVSGGLEWNR